MTDPHASPVTPRRGYFLLATVIFAYIGIYLCRKNLSVAVPILQKQWNLSKEEVGVVASASTIAYAIGKVAFGPVVDRLGGRNGILLAMLLVAFFGACGALAPGLGMLTAMYCANRLAGSAGWGSIIKLTPDWFPPAKLAFAIGVLSLSFVFGGALAVAFAGVVARLTHDNWRWVMGAPSIVLLAMAIICWWILPRAGDHSRAGAAAHASHAGWGWRHYAELFAEPQFYVLCALSFTLTFIRETFNFWIVDFFKTEGGPTMSNSIAAFLSTPFDILGGLGILALGWVYGRLGNAARRRLLFGILAALTVLLAGLPGFFHGDLWLVTAAVGLIGFLVLGPYSLLAGVLAVEVRGKEYAATVAGLVDASGYVAGILSGSFFGWLLSQGKYKLGFEFMAAMTLVSAFLCLALYRKRAAAQNEGAPNKSAS